MGCSKNTRMRSASPGPAGRTSGVASEVLPACDAAVQISASPPGTCVSEIQTVAASPPNMMQNWMTSFQITAWMPPSIV